MNDGDKCPFEEAFETPLDEIDEESLWREIISELSSLRYSI
ncbi:hypothetical protein [Alkalihalobacillus sp. LMS6]|jgi:hypothetical protein|nr:hypothetical protein [Alkalihalobacillus sp. LMS6]